MSSGQSINNVILNAGDSLTVQSGGSATGTTVNSGASETVYGSAVGTTVNGYGSEQVFSGGTTTGTVLNSGGTQSLFGGTATSTHVGSSATQTVYGGTAVSTAVGSSGIEYVQGGGAADHTRVTSGGEQIIFNSGVASGSVIEGGGQEIVTSGGKVLGGTFQSGSTLMLQGTPGSGSFADLGGSTLELSFGSGTLTGLGSTYTGVGSLMVDPGATWTLSGGNTLGSGATLVNSGSFSVKNGGLTVGGVVTNDGAFLIDPSQVVVGGLVGSGTTTIDGGSSLEVKGAVAGAQTVAFTGTHDTLILDSPTQFAGTISGLNSTDTIELVGFGEHATTDFENGILTVTSTDGTKTAVFKTYDIPLSTQFTPTGDGHGNALLSDDNPPCYCPGTLILTDRGEVAVEALKIGDRVVTVSGEAKPIKWIGRRSYTGRLAAGNPKVMPVCFKAGSLADNIPRRDLWVSPEHAMFIDGALVPAGRLVNGASIIKAETVEEVHYVHVELDSHDVILAEGAAAETFLDDDSRGLFHNAAEFPALYPEARRPSFPIYCAPRVDDGFALELLRERLAGRAARLRPDGTTHSIKITGVQDVTDRRRIRGWAQDLLAPDRAVPLVVLCDGAPLARVTADLHRRDIEAAGIGDGRHAFEVVLGTPLAADARHVVEVRAAEDWSLLRRSPAVIEPLAEGERRPPAGKVAALGALRGKFEALDRHALKGWVKDVSASEPVPLVVSVGDEVVGRVLAGRRRADLKAAGIGEGRHGYEFAFPKALDRGGAHIVRVRREADGTDVPGSPRRLEALSPYDRGIEAVLGDVLERTLGTEDEDRALALLTRETERLLARRAERVGGRAERDNLRLFQRRWGTGRNAGENEPSIPAPRLRALVIDDRLPAAGRDAGSTAILSHIRALKAAGHEVSLATRAMAEPEAALRLAREEEISVCGKPHYSCVEDVLSRQAKCFDVVYLHRLAVAQAYMALARTHQPKAKLVYGVADLHGLRLTRQAEIERRPELLGAARAAARAELSAAAEADLVLTHSTAEAAVLRPRIGAKVHVVPFAVEGRRVLPSFAGRHGVAFLGSFGHPPNPDAAYRLTQTIMPLVWAKAPDVTVRIAGSGWTASALGALDPRVEIVGRVADLDDFFATVRLTVAPLRFGAGIKGKVLDSFAAALPCVMSEVAAEGLSLPADLVGLVGQDAAALAGLILRLHADEAANQAFGTRGQAFVAGRFGQDHVTACFREALDHDAAPIRQSVAG